MRRQVLPKKSLTREATQLVSTKIYIRAQFLLSGYRNDSLRNGIYIPPLSLYCRKAVGKIQPSPAKKNESIFGEK